jgi:hypothetical protein
MHKDIDLTVLLFDMFNHTTTVLLGVYPFRHNAQRLLGLPQVIMSTYNC